MTGSPLLDDGEPDIAEYNDELEKRGNPKWHDVPWLYSECYMCTFRIAR
jgi:damage-control phosphatase, subfamily III